MDARLRAAALAAPGFMPEEEGDALYRAAVAGAERGPILEIGSYCGKSTVYLAAAAREARTVVYSIDHHRGSEEHQRGEEYFDEATFDRHAYRVDTFPTFRRTIESAGLDDTVVAIVAASEVAARGWSTPLGLVFIDGGHSQAAADTDYECWAPHVVVGGSLAIHDVFADPAEGGRPPFLLYRRALASGAFAEVAATGSLRVLERVGDGF